MITRSDQASRTDLERIVATIRVHNVDAPVIQSCTNVIGLEYLDGTPIDIDGGKKKVLAFAAIGRPQAFVSTLSSLGFEVVATRWWPDHHRYHSSEITKLLDNRRLPHHDLVVTTEKDAVKLALLNDIDPRAIGVVRIGVEMQDGGSAIIDQMLQNILRLSRTLAR
jgi:tetraacyldisaccharide 4'-kinase